MLSWIAGPGVFSADGAMSFIAWGNAPGISANQNLAALKARFRMHQALPRTIFPLDVLHLRLRTLIRACVRRAALLAGAISIFSLAVQAGDPKPLFPKALVTPEDVQEAIRIEWRLQKDYETLPEDGKDWFAVLPGNSTVLISAPHATAQMREGAKIC
jgi:hypothetical protein